MSDQPATVQPATNAPAAPAPVAQPAAKPPENQPQPNKGEQALGRQIAAAERRHQALDARESQLNQQRDELNRKQAELDGLGKLPAAELIERKAKELGMSYEEVLQDIIAARLGKKQDEKVDPATKKLQDELAALKAEREAEKQAFEREKAEAAQREKIAEVRSHCSESAKATLAAADAADDFDLAYETEAELTRAIWDLAVETIQKFEAKFKKPPADSEILQFIKEDAGPELVKRWKASERYKRLKARGTKAPEREPDKYTRRSERLAESLTVEKPPKENQPPPAEGKQARAARIRNALSGHKLPGESLIERTR
jgi:archaellum component FlaC